MRRDALGDFNRVQHPHRRRQVERCARRSTARGKKVFSARVGVGAPSTPTPSGLFYIREKFRVEPAGTIYGTHAHRHERVRADAVGLAGRRRRRPARDEPAAAHPGPPVARLRPPAQRRHRALLQARAARHADPHPLTSRAGAQSRRVADDVARRRAHVRLPARARPRAARRVVAAAADDDEGVAGLRVHRDPAAAAGRAPVHEAARAQRAREAPGAVQDVGHRARAVVGAVAERAVAAAVAVGLAGDAVRGADGVPDRRRGRRCRAGRRGGA